MTFELPFPWVSSFFLRRFKGLMLFLFNLLNLGALKYSCPSRRHSYYVSLLPHPTQLAKLSLPSRVVLLWTSVPCDTPTLPCTASSIHPTSSATSPETIFEPGRSSGSSSFSPPSLCNLAHWLGCPTLCTCSNTSRAAWPSQICYSW